MAAQLKVSTKTADKLVRSGYVTLAGVEAAEPAMLLGIDGIDQQELAAALARIRQ